MNNPDFTIADIFKTFLSMQAKLDDKEKAAVISACSIIQDYASLSSKLKNLMKGNALKQEQDENDLQEDLLR